MVDGIGSEFLLIESLCSFGIECRYVGYDLLLAVYMSHSGVFVMIADTNVAYFSFPVANGIVSDEVSFHLCGFIAGCLWKIQYGAYIC
ncbi:MAG TPA: hypothetical protein ACQGQH_05095 [Xylella sp.]